MNMKNRIRALEARTKGSLMAHWIDPSYPGQSYDDALAEYKASHQITGNPMFVSWNMFGSAEGDFR